MHHSICVTVFHLQIHRFTFHEKHAVHGVCSSHEKCPVHGACSSQEKYAVQGVSNSDEKYAEHGVCNLHLKYAIHNICSSQEKYVVHRVYSVHNTCAVHCVETLAKPLFIIFTESVSSGVVPLDCKLVNISPIYKKGSRSMVGNNRPMGLTCLASKLMGSCVKDAMLKHLLQNNLNTPNQLGFTKGHSFLTNVLETFESCTEDVDQGHSVDIILLDFQKAVDIVPKKRLLQKLSAYGIRGK